MKNYDEFDLKFSKDVDNRNTASPNVSISDFLSYALTSLINGNCKSAPPQCATSTDSRRSVCNFCTSSAYRVK